MGDYFVISAFSSYPLFVDHARCNWTSRSSVEVNIENERFTTVCSRGRLNPKFGNFTLAFGRLRQRIALKCVPHVQHGYFSSFNQSDHCFLASSLVQLPILRPKRLEIMKE